MKTIQKIIISIFIGLIGILPLQTRAVWGMGDINFDPSIFSQETIQTIGQVSQIVDMVQNALKTFGLDVVIYKVSQKLSQKLLNKVLNKANGGADGEDSKLFIENFGKYFENITQQQIGQFTNSLYDSSSPFAQSIFMGISNQNGGDFNSAKSLLESFSLGDNLPEGVEWGDVAGNISLAGDGAKGWDFYGKLAMPQNSPFGAGIIAQDDLAAQIKNAKETAKIELTSSGFKPDKALGGTSSILNGLGGSSGGFSFGGNNGNTEQDAITAKLKAEHDQGEAQYNADNGITSGGGSEPSLDKEVNQDGKIKSPTDTTKEQAKQSVTESFDRLRNADTFGKIIFGTIQQMITGLIQKGFSSLKSDGGMTQKPYGGIREVANILNQSNKTWANAPQQVVDLRHELEIGVEKTKLEISALNKTMNSIKKPLTDSEVYTTGGDTFKGTVLALEACVPGPDSGFEQRLNDYITKQLKDTQNRGGRDNDKGTRNTAALTRVREETNQALIEAKLLMSNNFLNIPGVDSMKAGLSSYYRMSKRFTGLINNLVIKQQVYNSLLVLQSEALSLGEQYNNNQPLILTEKKWNASGTNKVSIYENVQPEIITNFPEYLVADPINPGDRTVKPLPTDDPATANDEKDEEMMRRVLDVQWDKWETLVPEDKKQSLYAKYIALTQDISDSSSAQKAQVVAQGTEEAYQQLKDLLHDCKEIRQHITTGNINPANDDVFIATLKSDGIRATYKGSSILTAIQNDIDFGALNKRITETAPSEDSMFTPGTTEWVGEQADQGNPLALIQFNEWLSQQIQSGNTSPNPNDFNINAITTNSALQVQDLAQDSSAVIAQDDQELLFCRLPYYTMVYWAPNGLTGEPIGCNDPGPKINANDYGDSLAKKSPHAKWYHTNNAEILFAVSGGIE